MGLLRRIFRVREYKLPIIYYVIVIVMLIAIPFCILYFVEKICSGDYNFSYRERSALVGLPMVGILIDKLSDSRKYNSCIKKGKKYKGTIIGRTKYEKLEEADTLRWHPYSAKLIIQYSGGRKYITSYLLREQIERIVSYDCRVYIYDGKICADDFRCTLFRSKRCIELDTLKFPQEI